MSVQETHENVTHFLVAFGNDVLMSLCHLVLHLQLLKLFYMFETDYFLFWELKVSENTCLGLIQNLFTFSFPPQNGS